MVVAVEHVPTGALYSLLVVLHVLSAVVGFGAVVLSGVEAGRARLGPAAPGADSVRRYFRPGVNWAGRALYGVPVFGFGSLAASHGRWQVGDGFVVVGLVLWLLAAAAAELVVWPAERRVQAIVTNDWGEERWMAELTRQCGRISSAAVLLAALFVVAVVVMVARP